MSRNAQGVKRFRVIEHRGVFKRPVVEVDVTRSDFLSEDIYTLDFNGETLAEPNLFGYLYLRFADGLESFEFAARVSGCYIIQ